MDSFALIYLGMVLLCSINTLLYTEAAQELSLAQRWVQFKDEYKKNYNAVEDAKR